MLVDITKRDKINQDEGWVLVDYSNVYGKCVPQTLNKIMKSFYM